MALLTVQAVDKDGISLTMVTPTASTGDTFVASDDQRHAIVAVNGSGSPVNVTVTAQLENALQQGVGNVAVADIVHAVAAGAVAVIPVMPAFIRTNDGVVQFVVSSVTDVDVAVMRLPRLV
ncbi:MAG: hypothetical protein SV862_00210 [Pseudomonadota bacterium]|nr:hypothetical protein [Pseudomonadota bacterium]